MRPRIPIFWAFAALLFGISLFFTVTVESRRVAWAEGLEFPSGTEVTVIDVPDGDEVRVEHDDARIHVRLLGVKCFSVKVNEPGITGMGEACQSELQRLLTRRPITLEYGEFKVDSQRRVLAYVHAAGEDVGEQLVESGLAMVYTKYRFERESAYLDAEQRARDKGRGLWGNARTRDRTLKLKEAWARERDDD